MISEMASFHFMATADFLIKFRNYMLLQTPHAVTYTHFLISNCKSYIKLHLKYVCSTNNYFRPVQVHLRVCACATLSLE